MTAWKRGFNDHNHDQVSNIQRGTLLAYSGFTEPQVNWLHPHPKKLPRLLGRNMCPFGSLHLPNVWHPGPSYTYPLAQDSKLFEFKRTQES